MVLNAIPGASCACTPITRYACGHCWHDTCLTCGQCAAIGSGGCICHCRLGFTPTEQSTAPTFWLGTHHGRWLTQLGVPLCIAVENINYSGPLPRAVAPWMLDSSGFNHVGRHGEWTFTAVNYAAMVQRCRNETGMLAHAASMDWMCEPEVLAKTGLTVAEHQARTVGSYLDLMALDDTLPFMPVIQGWTLADYERCVDLYDRAGIDLTAQPLVGLGSICKRQGTPEATAIITTLADRGIALHGFGLKLQGLANCANSLAGADSFAWSYTARRHAAPLPECEGKHATCANCRIYALTWRERKVLPLLDHPRQMRLPMELAA